MTTTIDATAFAGLLTDDFAGFDDSLPQYELTGEITTVKAGEWHESRETVVVSGTERPFNVRWRFVAPILSSVILRKTVTPQNPDGRIDFNATVVSNREMEIQVGNDWYTLSDFVAHAIRQGSASAAGKSNEDILHTLRQYGFDPAARFPMYLQHLGAGPDAFNHISEDFKARGATENTDEVRSRASGTKSHVLAAFRHREGIPVVSMEISKANRELSQTHSGFIGFFDATWSTLTKGLDAHRQRLALDAVLKDPASAQEVRDAAAAREVEIRKLFTVPTLARAFRNWGGTTEVQDILDENAVPRYFAQQVPCGRLSVGSEASPSVYSVWTTSRQQAVTPVPAAMANLEQTETPGEEPF